MTVRRICDLCNQSSPLLDTRCDRCVEWAARGGMIRYGGQRVSPPWKATARGEFVLATFGTLLLLAMLGIAGWIEGGMQ